MVPGFYNFWSLEFWVFVGRPWVPTPVGAGLPLCQKNSSVTVRSWHTILELCKTLNTEGEILWSFWGGNQVMDLYELSTDCFGWSIWLCELNCLVTYVASGGNLAQDFKALHHFTPLSAGSRTISCFSHSHLNWVVFIGGAKSVTLTVSGTWWDNTGKLSNSQCWAQQKWKNCCFLYHVKLRSDPKPAVFVQSTRQYLASDVGNSASCIPGVIIATTDF
jgi:hypothetical protein